MQEFTETRSDIDQLKRKLKKKVRKLSKLRINNKEHVSLKCLRIKKKSKKYHNS